MTIKRKKSFDIKRLIVAGSALLILGLIGLSMLSPDSIVMSLADGSTSALVVRTAVLITLTAILFSRPPRSLLFRYLLGAMSSLILIVTFVSMADYHVGIIDAIVYLQVSIIFALEALEHQSAANQGPIIVPTEA